MSRATLFVSLIALTVRCAVMLLQPGLTYDGTYYLRQAERLLDLDYKIIGFPPGYPFAVALLDVIVRDAVLAGRLVGLAAGTATVALFHRWARRLLPARLALAGALVLAVHPHFARTSVEVLSEPVYILAVLAGVVLFEARRHLLAGAVLGYAFLVRPEALLVLLGLALIHVVRERKPPWAFLVTGLVPVLVYATLSSLAVGRVVVTPKQGQLDIGADVFRRTWTALTTMHSVFPVVLLPAALVHGLRTRSRLIVPILYLLLLPWYDIHIQERLHLPALPFLVVLAMAWVATLRLRYQCLVLIGSAALLVYGASPGFVRLGRPGIMTPHAREIGMAFRPHLKFEDRVAGRFPFVAYYAGAGFVRQPLLSYHAFMDSIVSTRATHLLVLENEMYNISPQLRPLFYEAGFVAAEGRLEAVARTERFPGSRAILYKLGEPAIPAHVSRIERVDAAAATWLGSTLLMATRVGRLEALDSGVSGVHPAADAWPALQRLSGVREPSASEDGTRFVFVQEDVGGARIAEFDVRSQALTTYPETAGDRPGSPAYAGRHILYVARAAPGGLRALDPRTRRVRDARLQGLDPSEATPLAVTTRGADVAITFARTRPTDDSERVLATATWPQTDTSSSAEDVPIELPGRWATELRLSDDAVSWVPDADRLVASLAIHITDETGATTRIRSSLCVVQAGGLFRRLTFGVESARRPVLRGTRVAFLAGAGELRTATVEPRDLRIPEVRVFEPPPGFPGP
ncbi:MAG: glycosyltransferase family 39 protein [Candidatus Krumholzibacteriia bacterium]